MKYEIHVPVELYGYIAAEVEGTPEDALEAYQAVKKASQTGQGLPTKEWCRFLDFYVNNGQPPQDGLVLWEQMDEKQRWMINELKKTFKRAIKTTN